MFYTFRLREEAEAALAASKAELERQMCHQRDQLMQEVHEAQNQLVRARCLVKKTHLLSKAWFCLYILGFHEDVPYSAYSKIMYIFSPQMTKQQLVAEMEGTQWKLEEEKRLLEEQILRDRKISQSLDASLQSPPFPSSNFLQEVMLLWRFLVTRWSTRFNVDYL